MYVFGKLVLVVERPFFQSSLTSRLNENH